MCWSFRRQFCERKLKWLKINWDFLRRLKSYWVLRILICSFEKLLAASNLHEIWIILIYKKFFIKLRLYLSKYNPNLLIALQIFLHIHNLFRKNSNEFYEILMAFPLKNLGHHLYDAIFISHYEDIFTYYWSWSTYSNIKFI